MNEYVSELWKLGREKIILSIAVESVRMDFFLHLDINIKEWLISYMEFLNRKRT